MNGHGTIGAEHRQKRQNKVLKAVIQSLTPLLVSSPGVSQGHQAMSEGMRRTAENQILATRCVFSGEQSGEQ
jgi:hypothetical protein